MGKLHEVLAVQGDLEGTAKHLIEEAIGTFQKKGEHFLEIDKTFTMFDEDRQAENSTEHKPMVETVQKKLAFVGKAVVR